jgi:hypothetical protein
VLIINKFSVISVVYLNAGVVDTVAHGSDLHLFLVSLLGLAVAGDGGDKDQQYHSGTSNNKNNCDGAQASGGVVGGISRASCS